MDDAAKHAEAGAFDLHAAGPGAVAAAFANQSAYCRTAHAPVTARIVEGLAALLAGDLARRFLEAMRQWPGAPLADALPLRAAAGLHALHLGGSEPALALLYASEPADDCAVLAAVTARRDAALLPWLAGPPQTNEAGRSSNFAAAMLWLADRGLPPRFHALEIGSSAGINLLMDRYAYDLGGVTLGPRDPVLHLAPQWEGAPPPARAITIAALSGCDIAPIDLADPREALRLKAYIWPEHTERFARFEAAVAAIRDRPPALIRLDAASFVERELARPQEPGTTRVLVHSIVWQYLPAGQQARITAAMESAGAAASAERALAWIAVEANRTLHRHELRVRYWPGGGGEDTLLALSHPHGAQIAWRG